ncbi:MAG: SMI1/KNR4 family protein [Pseudanabaenales cyanobacterium]|nr:SMI1/KNR4 family protein [Pseudanabaenales cyanobacterium]
MMENIYVKGLPLPGKLVEMISSGRWQAPKNKDLIKRLGIKEVELFALLNLAGIKNNSTQLRKLAQDGYGKSMGLVSDGSKILMTGYLDPTKALVIGATYSDEILCLDYSDSNNPRVVATNDTERGTRWVVVAEKFEELVNLLEL